MKNEIGLTLVECVDIYNIIQTRLTSLTEEDLFYGEFGRKRLNDIKDKFDNYILNHLTSLKKEIKEWKNLIILKFGIGY